MNNNLKSDNNLYLTANIGLLVFSGLFGLFINIDPNGLRIKVEQSWNNEEKGECCSAKPPENLIAISSSWIGFFGFAIIFNLISILLLILIRNYFIWVSISTILSIVVIIIFIGKIICLFLHF